MPIASPPTRRNPTAPWSGRATTLVTVHVDRGGALDIPARWHDMAAALRNAAGRRRIDGDRGARLRVWDAKAKLLGIPLAGLLGVARDSIPVYGSGGFTSYSTERLDARADLERVAYARQRIPESTALFVDANGAYSRKQALAQADAFAGHGVAGMAISAGEYGYDLAYFRRMLEAGAVDVLQADATRCGGITGFLGAAALCEARSLPLSSHCTPSLHLPLCCAAQPAVHLEYFHDHVRIEQLLFDGAPRPQRGLLRPDVSRPGLGVELKTRDAERYRV